MYQTMPGLSRSEYTDLFSDIESNGLRHAIEIDESGYILDGHHRAQILGALGRDVPVVVVPGLDTDTAKRAYSLRVNLVRRQLSPAQTQELREERKRIALDMLKDGATQEVAAAAVGVAQRTVSDWLDTSFSGSAKAGKTEAPTGEESTEEPPNEKTAETEQPKRPDARVKLSREGKKRAAAMVLDTGMTQQEVASEFKVSQQSISNAVRAESARRERLDEERRAREEMESQPDGPGFEIRRGDFQEVLADLPDASVDLIVTDPPYGDDHTHLYGELAEFGARVLKPGGSLIAYAGQGNLPGIYAEMGHYLRYWWTLCLRHRHGGQRLPGKWVMVEWKPILWYVNGNRDGRDYVADSMAGSKPRKDLHEWAQGTAEVAYLIEKLTIHGALVVDPFAGSGSFGVAANELGRNFIGAENGSHKDAAE